MMSNDEYPAPLRRICIFGLSDGLNLVFEPFDIFGMLGIVLSYRPFADMAEIVDFLGDYRLGVMRDVGL